LFVFPWGADYQVHAAVVKAVSIQVVNLFEWRAAGDLSVHAD